MPYSITHLQGPRTWMWLSLRDHIQLTTHFLQQDSNFPFVLKEENAHPWPLPSAAMWFGGLGNPWRWDNPPSCCILLCFLLFPSYSYLTSPELSSQPSSSHRFSLETLWLPKQQDRLFEVWGGWICGDPRWIQHWCFQLLLAWPGYSSSALGSGLRSLTLGVLQPPSHWQHWSGPGFAWGCINSISSGARSAKIPEDSPT